MVALVWDKPGERFYETGVDRGVYYPSSGSPGVAWNGLISVTEDVSGGDVSSNHMDSIKFYDIVENEDFQATVEAFSAPAAFLNSDGIKSIATGLYVTQQPRTRFNLSYRTLIGSDTIAAGVGYKIHLVYNATAAPTSRQNKTIAKDPDLIRLSWKIDTVPPTASTYKPSAHMIIDTSLITASKKLSIENILYGTASTTPRMPLQSEVVTILSAP